MKQSKMVEVAWNSFFLSFSPPIKASADHSLFSACPLAFIQAIFAFRQAHLVLASLITCSVLFGVSSAAYAQNKCRCKGCSYDGQAQCGCGCSASTIDLPAAEADESLAAVPQVSYSTAGCSGGMAGAYPCHGVNLLSHLGLAAMGGGTTNKANDIWGWTSADTGINYALVGRTDGTRFVDLSDPTNPVYLGNLPRTAGTSISTWRDIKVYDNHAYIVADYSSGSTNHGMQVFNLAMLDTVDRSVAMSSPLTFSPLTTYNNFTRAHNLAINEDTGFAYALGSNTQSGGLHAIDLQNPASPTFAGGFSGDGYTHDAQVVLYNGPDSGYLGREVAFSSNENTLTIVDITSKTSPSQVSRTTYQSVRYAHQGWLTEDHRYFIMNDELDERDVGSITRTRTHVWDVSDLQNPQYLGAEPLRSGSTDHNLYTSNGLVFESNYQSGLRILDTRDIRNGDLYEVGWFDTLPGRDDVGFQGAWSAYHFSESGVTIVNNVGEGLFVLDTSGIVAGAPTLGLMNGSFEDIEQGQRAATLPDDSLLSFTGTAFSAAGNSYDYDIPGWVGPPSRAIVVNGSDHFISGGAIDGENYLLLQSALTQVTVRQTLADVLEKDTTYALSVQVGETLISGDAGYDIGLYAGNTLLANIQDTDPGAPQLTQGAFSTVELFVDSRDYISLEGLPLQIKLSTRLLADGSDLGRTLFDAVSLEIEPLQAESCSHSVPEPSSQFLYLLCGLLLCRRRRLKAKHNH